MTCSGCVAIASTGSRGLRSFSSIFRRAFRKYWMASVISTAVTIAPIPRTNVMPLLVRCATLHRDVFRSLPGASVAPDLTS
jgi:hypothetical protein